MFRMFRANTYRHVEGSRGNMNGKWRAFLIVAAVCSNDVWAQVPFSTRLELDVENIVSYASDLFDASKFAMDPNLTTAAPVRNFQFVMAIGDIVAVNGEPAKGSMIAGSRRSL
jgi:hypothetical protein